MREACDSSFWMNSLRSSTAGSPSCTTYPKAVRSDGSRRSTGRAIVATMLTFGRMPSCDRRPGNIRRQFCTSKATAGAVSKASMITTTGLPLAPADATALLQNDDGDVELPGSTSVASSGKTWAPAAAAAASATAPLPSPDGPERRTALRLLERQKSRETSDSAEVSGNTTASRRTAFASARPTISAIVGDVCAALGPDPPPARLPAYSLHSAARRHKKNNWQPQQHL
eukprot:gnl/TRDRNA2_/TRDRNA2_168997_c1_seq1.p1 gnl/TRDRNA2_/TRDRNA2_168997_c1~~gnl/TRDRNA2_/TRDRNA2_168997_c1_seq1.p1  ORF type:complete len:228 (-),score=27.23 gnl/TRDRNA2_/TRDRNA2_168997_c1_seq1:115-798(-)